MKSRMFVGGALVLLALLLSSSQAKDEGFHCNTSAKADIILLVDGSWSIGRINFRTVRRFLAGIASPFDIGPDKVQIGLVQFSGDPRTEWHLNAHATRESLLNAVSNLLYKGGNTNTGLAMDYIFQNNFQTRAGMREDSRKICVLLTDGKSQDETLQSSQRLKDSGVELYAIGVKNVEESDLRPIASDPVDTHVHFVMEFTFLQGIMNDLTASLCNSIRSFEATPNPPTNLMTSEVTGHSLRASWTAPAHPVDKYRVWYLSNGGVLEEVLVDGSVTSVVLDTLTARTEYLISVFTVVGEESSQPLKGSGTTGEEPEVEAENQPASHSDSD